MGTYWADTSHYQTTVDKSTSVPIDDSYPHRVYSFRTNSGDGRDNLAIENAIRAKSMLERGKLEIVIPYYFFRPGQANCDLHRDLLKEAGLWGHPRTATMVDVEGDGGKIRGDQSFEVDDEIARLRTWYGHPNKVIGYWNPNADPGLWLTRPPNFKLIIPQYNGRPGDLSTVRDAKARGEAFAHQYTSTGSCPPWPLGVDLNYTELDVNELLGMLGMEGNKMGDVVATGAAQLHPFAGKIRQIENPEHVNESTRNPQEPWPADTWYDIWNEVVWDGFTLPVEDLAEDARSSLVAWTLDTNKRLRRVEKLLQRLVEEKE